jgi:bacterioferritin
MEKKTIISLLNKDLEDEHGAIIQYLSHAYAMGEGEMACEIEAIARDEMRHLDWLAETVVALGGTPSLERGKMLMGDGAVSNWMQNNVLLEEGAITQYKEHIEAIGDPKIKRLLGRILADEESHRSSFQHFVSKAQKEVARDRRGNNQDKTASLLNWGIEHEYTVILQYLLHSYLARKEAVKQEMEDQAINEMQHLGWLAEEMVGSGGNPRIEHSSVYRGNKTADRLQADIKVEQEVAAEYDRAARESKEPDLKKLLLRIRDNEKYHIDVFNDLLQEEKEQQGSGI